MIDRSIPYMPVMMIRRDDAACPSCELPKGYAFDFCRKDTGKEEWIYVQYASGQMDDVDVIRKLYDSEFMDREQEIYRRMLFVRDENGKAVASASLWFGSPFGEEIDRIHWVATDCAHQGKGICRAMLKKLLELHYALGSRGGVYLISQTFSYAAINIYQEFGFERYMGPEPPGWHVENFEETAKDAWRLIDQKINEYRK